MNTVDTSGEQGVIFTPRRPRWLVGILKRLAIGSVMVWVDDGPRLQTKWESITIPTNPGVREVHIVWGMALSGGGSRNIAVNVRVHEWVEVNAMPGMMRSPRVWITPHQVLAPGSTRFTN
jgi:hypothetical protein